MPAFGRSLFGGDDDLNLAGGSMCVGASSEDRLTREVSVMNLKLLHHCSLLSYPSLSGLCIYITSRPAERA